MRLQVQHCCGAGELPNEAFRKMQVAQFREKTVRGLEWLLWIAAALCLGAVSLAGVVASESRQRAFLVVAQAKTAPATRRSADAAKPEVRDKGEVIGRLEISLLGLSVPVTAGIETSSLLRGVGHIEGTAYPGGLGTLGLAGHRDTYFRPLRNIKDGMDIRVTDDSGTYHYEVDSTEVVLPEQVDVLAIRSRPELTLVTCYPFDYVGAAPKRFIVHAHLLSASPDAKP